MSFLDVTHQSFSSNKPWMWFFLLHWLALWWKYFVFLSPANSQIDLDLCFQNNSSWNSKEFLSLLTFCITSQILALFIEVKASNSLYFSSIFVFELPKVPLHSTNAPRHFFFFFSNSLYIGLPVGFHLFYTSCIMLAHVGCDAQCSSNRCGFFLCLPTRGSPSVVSRMGLWPKYAAWRWCTLLWGNKSCHSIFAHARSNLSWKNSIPGLPFLQVKIFPLKPRSISPQCNNALWNSSIRQRERGTHPCFSSDDSISL